MIFDEITQVAVVFLANRRLETDRLLADLDDLAHLLRADLHLLSDFLGRRFAPQVLQQTAADANQAVDRLHHVDGNTNRAGLVSDSTGNGLANPPGGIRAELVPLRVIELFDGTNQTNIPLLDQVQQAHTAANVLFRDTDHQAQVRLGQAALGLFTIFNNAIITQRGQPELLVSATLHAARQAHLFLGGKQGNTPDLAQVHAHGIVQAALQVSNY